MTDTNNSAMAESADTSIDTSTGSLAGALAGTGPETKQKKKPSLGSVVKSVLAAGIGVQSNKNRERDFEDGSPLAFIIGGVIFTIVFIATVALVVGFVLSKN